MEKYCLMRGGLDQIAYDLLAERVPKFTDRGQTRRRIHIFSPHFSRYNIKPSNYEQLVSDQAAAKLANICPDDLALQIPAKNISRVEFSTTNTVVGIKIRTYLITGQFDSLILHARSWAEGVTPRYNSAYCSSYSIELAISYVLSSSIPVLPNIAGPRVDSFDDIHRATLFTIWPSPVSTIALYTPPCKYVACPDGLSLAC